VSLAAGSSPGPGAGPELRDQLPGVPDGEDVGDDDGEADGDPDGDDDGEADGDPDGEADDEGAGVAIGRVESRPHLRAEPLPIRIATFPLPAAATIAFTRVTVRLVVQFATPAFDDRTEAIRAMTGPTAPHVPLWRTTGKSVAGRIFMSLTLSAPVPVVNACTFAVPFAPRAPIFACQALDTVADEATEATTSEPTRARASARPTISHVQARILCSPVRERRSASM